MTKLLRIVASAGVLTTLAASYAPDVSAQYLRIGGPDNAKTFKLADNPKIYFKANGLTVTDDVTSVDFSYAQIGKLEFKNGQPTESSVNSPVDTELQVSRNGDSFLFGSNAEVSVFSCQGALVSKCAVTAGSELSISHLNSGIYVMLLTDSNNKTKTLKIRK